MSDRRTFALLRYLTGFFLAATFSFTVYLAWNVGPYVERWVLGPVVSKLRIISIDETEQGHSIIRVEFTKLRACDYGGIAWFTKVDGVAERVAVELMRLPNDTSSPNRPLGTQRAGPWVVHLQPETLRNNSFAIVSHHCHGLWLTFTEFYP